MDKVDIDHKKHISIIIDYCMYTPAVFQAAVDVAVAAKRTNYADITVVVPPSLLYEYTKYKAFNAKQLLSSVLRKDKGVRQLRSMFEYGLREQVLQIPTPTPAETEFFSSIERPADVSAHLTPMAGPRSPADFADFAIVEWLKSHQPDATHHFIISSRDDGVVTGLINSVRGDPHMPDHLNYFENVDQKCMALWLTEESEHIKQSATRHLQGGRPNVEDVIQRMESSLMQIANIKSDKASHEKRITKMLDRAFRANQTDSFGER